MSIFSLVIVKEMEGLLKATGTPNSEEITSYSSLCRAGSL